jgi:hypothetical protein
MAARQDGGAGTSDVGVNSSEECAVTGRLGPVLLVPVAEFSSGPDAERVTCGVTGGGNHVQVLTRKVRQEYLAWPGLSLTLPQAARLWDTDQHTCRSVFRDLVASGFLRQRDDDRFVRCEEQRYAIATAAARQQMKGGRCQVKGSGPLSAAARGSVAIRATIRRDARANR